MKKLIYFIMTMLVSQVCICQDSQYTGKSLLKHNVKSEILIDSLTSTKFILDEAHIYITAINMDGDTLWKTDPIVDIKMDYYRVTRPTIVKYYFQNNERTDFKEVIWIVYNNSQFGTIEKETGFFTFYGQD